MKTKICGIYKITSPSGRIYIGKSIDIKRRFSEYRRLRCKSQIKLYNSLLKYGVENHIFEIIEECEIENLDCLECYWIDHYNSINRNFGLNTTDCTCDENKLILNISPETREKISKTLKEQNKKLREEDTVKIFQYDKQGVLLRIWKNYNELIKETSFLRSYIHRTIKEGTLGYNFLWSYEETVFDKKFLEDINKSLSDKYKGINKGRVVTQEQKEYLSKKLKGQSVHSEEFKNNMSNLKQKPVVQINREDEVVKFWKSASEASSVLNIHSQNISQCCRGKLKSAGNYKWKYL